MSVFHNTYKKTQYYFNRSCSVAFELATTISLILQTYRLRKCTWKRDSGTGVSLCEISKDTFSTQHLQTTASGSELQNPTNGLTELHTPTIGLRYRSIHRSCSLKTLFLEEETPAQVFSSEFYESFINSLFTEHLQKTEHSVVRFCLHFKEYMLRTSTLFQKSFACLRFALFHAPWRNTGSEKNYCNHRAPSWRFLSLSKFTWDPKWAQTGLRFHFGIKFHFGVR